jgi:hypothetical protein
LRGGCLRAEPCLPDVGALPAAAPAAAAASSRCFRFCAARLITCTTHTVCQSAGDDGAGAVLQSRLEAAVCMRAGSDAGSRSTYAREEECACCAFAHPRCIQWSASCLEHVQHAHRRLSPGSDKGVHTLRLSGTASAALPWAATCSSSPSFFAFRCFLVSTFSSSTCSMHCAGSVPNMN